MIGRVVCEIVVSLPVLLGEPYHNSAVLHACTLTASEGSLPCTFVNISKSGKPMRVQKTDVRHMNIEFQFFICANRVAVEIGSGRLEFPYSCSVNYSDAAS